MSSSLVSGPYASAVSIKFTPNSTALRRTLSAFCRSGGQPQMPSPVTRIAPKPSRLTVRSPPNFQVGFVPMFAGSDDSAPKIAPGPLARSAAPVTSVLPRNVRRVTPCSSFDSEDFLSMLFSVRPPKSLSTKPHRCLVKHDYRLRMEPARPRAEGHVLCGPSPVLRFSEDLSSARARERRMLPQDLCRRLEYLFHVRPSRQSFCFPRQYA